MVKVILVDNKNRAIGTEEKLRAHIGGKLHRAFSIFVFDADKRLLLQKRAKVKYHSGGLWSNTCCGHPFPGELIQQAAHRRLREEMDFDCELQESFRFLYRAELENKLVEHEYNHVLIGEFNGEPAPDRNEVEDWQWLKMRDLKMKLNEDPNLFTSWLRIAIARSDWQEID